MQEKLRAAEDLISIDVNKALDSFNEIIKEHAENMKTKIAMDKKVRGNNWFDQECRIAKRNVRRLLRKFRRTLDKDDRILFCIARREYKKFE